MNLQGHLSGQFSGSVSNQAGPLLSGLPHQGGNAVSSQIQNSSINGNAPNMDPEYVNTRAYMREKIFECLMQGNQRPHEVTNKKMFDLVKRLEEALFKTATTTEDYFNLATLKSRLHVLIKRLPLSNQTHQFAHPNPSPSLRTMIPTPGLQQTMNSGSNGTHSMDNSLANKSSNPLISSAINYGNFLPAGNRSSSNVHGAIGSGYQPSSMAFSVNSVQKNMVTSMGMQKMTSQMIPTPGFSNSNCLTGNPNSQEFSNMESCNISGAFPAVESSPMPQTMELKQPGQNSRILHNISGGINLTMQQKSCGLLNGNNRAMRMMGNNMSMINDPKTTEGHLSGSMYGNPNRQLHQHFDEHQPEMQGNEFGVSAADASASGNIHAPAPLSSFGSVVNNQSLSMSVQSMQKTNPSMTIISQTNAHSATQLAALKQQSVDHSGKFNFQPDFPAPDNLVPSHQHQQVQHSHHFKRQQQVQQRQLSQNQSLLKNDPFSQSQLSSSLVSQPNFGPLTETLQQQVFDQFQFSNVQSQFQNSSIQDPSRVTELLSHLNAAQDISSSLTRTSDQVTQVLNQQEFVSKPQAAFACISGGSQWSQGVSHVKGVPPFDQNLRSEFHHGLTVQDANQMNNLSSEESAIGQSDSSRPEGLPNSRNSIGRSKKLDQEKMYKNQQRWLLFLRHARRCHAPEGKCQEPNCITVQKLLKHVEHCNVFQCSHRYCHSTRILIDHHRCCRSLTCAVCIPVKNFVQRSHTTRTDSRTRLTHAVNGSCKPCETGDNAGRPTSNKIPLIAENQVDLQKKQVDLQPSIKRIRIEKGYQSVFAETAASTALASPIQLTQHPEQHHVTLIPVKSEITEVKMEVKGTAVRSTSKMSDMKNDHGEDAYIPGSVHPNSSTIPAASGIQEVIKNEKELGPSKLETATLPSEISKSGKPKVKGVSMTELFTPEQVRQHISGLRRWVGQSKAKAEKNQAMEHSMSENSCQLCAVEKLSFEPPPIYCTPCGARIKRNAMYYAFGAGDTRHYLCIPCCNETRGDSILVDGTSIPKARLEKKKNDEETEEWWVQCDKCEAWQHQICALFNGRRNDGGQAEYTCPNCYIEEVERGERIPLPQSAVLGADDLPRTILSDHMEQRLFSKLKQERLDRARLLGKSYDEVPGAEALVIRVVSSVDKKLEVKSRFLDMFQDENYPSEFPYKSKVVLLFQKIEGVEVCLFGMYVQEFGSECSQPNHRRVYLSYLDSVKYFRPEVRAVTGEALRTFVYHEILIGYLEYCKKRGFTSCYIWACPPLKGEDYILYCHPEIQKTPKSDKLREWYLSMLRKAMKENIVVELTNLYDHFFVSMGECKAKVTAARLPYFDGDYWPGAAEDMIYQLQKEEEEGKLHKKGAVKKTFTKRGLKASGQTDLSGNASKDLLLMHKLGESISPMKEDFIMVHLQHACSHCCLLMVSGNRWVCKQCKKFQLCDKCYDCERKRDDRERHPVNHKEKHSLYPMEITGVPEDTKDKDEILESEFFDTRQAFLSLCQGNHYQYDTLRRAKHSSMMVLYHLHNPTAPAFVTTCNVCHLDIESGQGWRCETCPDYDVCNSCHQKDGGADHPHKLTNHPTNDRDAQNQEARQLRVLQLRKMLDLLVHASKCRSSLCQYPNCLKVKGLFRHGILCKVRATGGCPLCKKMWYLLQLHARACKESECTVPRCRDLKIHMRRLQQQSDSRRRAAVMEMMRQRAAEVATNS